MHLKSLLVELLTTSQFGKMKQYNIIKFTRLIVTKRVIAGIILLLVCCRLTAGKNKQTEFLTIPCLSWNQTDSSLRSLLALCPRAIDSVRTLREFTAIAVKGSRETKLYDLYKPGIGYSLPELYDLYTSDASVAICFDYANFFSKILTYYGIENYILATGLPGVLVGGHAQVAVVVNTDSNEVVQVHDPNFNMEYVNTSGEPIDVREQIKYIESGNFKGKVSIREGRNPRSLLLTHNFWKFFRVLNPSYKQIKGNTLSNNAQVPHVVFYKESLHNMLHKVRKNTRNYISKYIGYKPPRNARMLELMLPVAINCVEQKNQKSELLKEQIKREQAFVH